MRELDNFRKKSEFSGFTFLVVDDHKFSRQIVSEVLRTGDAARVVEAADGRDALKILGKSVSDSGDPLSLARAQKKYERIDDRTDNRVLGPQSFDCIITDFNMSPVNGLQLLKCIRTGRAKCPRDVPVVMLTGYSDDYLISAALALDVNALVLKPVSRENIFDKVGRVLMRPIEVLEVASYNDVAMPENSELTGMDDMSAGGAAPKNGTDGAKMVALEDIREGSVFDQDLRGPTGVLLMEQGTNLTGMLIERLLDLKGLKGMPEAVQVIE